jgi:hypothetical protein
MTPSMADPSSQSIGEGRAFQRSPLSPNQVAAPKPASKLRNVAPSLSAQHAGARAPTAGGIWSHAVTGVIRTLFGNRSVDFAFPPMRRLARAGRGCERRLAIASPQWCGDNDPRDPLGSSNAQALSLQYTCSPSGGFPYHRPPTRGCLNNVPDISACLEWARLLEGSTWSSTYLVCRWSLSSLASR